MQTIKGNPFQLLASPEENKKKRSTSVAKLPDYQYFPAKINISQEIKIIKNKPSIISVKQGDIQHTFRPLKLSSSILQYLFDNKKILFDRSGNKVKIVDFPSVVENIFKFESVNELRQLGILKQGTHQKVVKVKELSSKYDDKSDNMIVTVEDFNTHQKYELNTSAKYIKRIKKYLAVMLNFSNDSFNLIDHPVNIKHLLVDKEDIKYVTSEKGAVTIESQNLFVKGIDFENEYFIFNSSNDTLKLQKYVLHKCIHIDGKNYIIFGFPDPFKMTSYYTSKLSESSSIDRLTRIREFWNFMFPDNQIVKDENGEWTYWKLCDLDKKGSKDKVHLKYILEDPESLMNMLNTEINKYIKTLLSRNDILIKYEFHIFEILSDKGQIKLESPIKRINEINYSHINLLTMTKEAIKSLIFNQTNFKINNDKTIRTDKDYPSNLLMYARNTGYFHFTAEYIDSLSNTDLSYYHLHNIYTIEDLINGIKIWKQIDMIYYVSENKLNGKNEESNDDEYDQEDTVYEGSQSGGGRFVELANLVTRKEVILFNIKMDGIVVCIIKAGHNYYTLYLYPNLHPTIAKESLVNETIFKSFSKINNMVEGSQFLTVNESVYRYEIIKLSDDNKLDVFNKTKISLIPIIKVEFKKPSGFYTQPMIGDYVNPSLYIPFLSKNLMYNYLSRKIKGQLNTVYNKNHTTVLRYNNPIKVTNQLRLKYDPSLDFEYTVVENNMSIYSLICINKEGKGSEDVEKVIWVIPKLESLWKSDEKTIFDFFNRKLTNNDVPGYLPNIYKIDPLELNNVKESLECLKNVISIETKTELDKIFFILHFFYPSTHQCLHIHIFKMRDYGYYKEPFEGEKNLDRIGRAITFDNYYNLGINNYYTNPENTYSFYSYITYTIMIMQEYNKYVNSISHIGGNGIIEKQSLYYAMNNYSKNNIFMVSENKIFNIMNNFNNNILNKINNSFNVHLYTTQSINIMLLKETKNIDIQYFKNNNKNIFIITNTFTFMILLLIGNFDKHTIDLQLFLNKDVLKDNNNDNYVNILSKSKNINNISNDYNTEIDLIFNKIKTGQGLDKKKDLVICTYSVKEYNDDIFVKTFLIGLYNIKKNGTLLYCVSMNSIAVNKKKYLNFYALVIKLFKNYKIKKSNDFNYITNYIIIIEFFDYNNIYDFNTLLNWNNLLITDEDINKAKEFINEINTLKYDYQDFITISTEYFKYEPENYIKYYIKFLLNDISSILTFFKENKISFDDTFLPDYYNYYQSHITKFFSFNYEIKEKINNYSIIKSKKKLRPISLTKKKNILNINSYPPYAYDYFNKKKELMLSIKKLQEYFTNDLYPKYYNITKISDSLADNIFNYLKIKYNLPKILDTSFINHWEILRTFKLFNPTQKTYYTFHNNDKFNWCCNYFIKNAMKGGKHISNTLEPNFIYNRKNIMNVRNNNDIKYDLLTSDIINLNKMSIEYRQILELGQLCMIAALEPNTCIVKSYLPFMKESNEYYSGQMISIIYLYSLLFQHIYLFKTVTSKPTETEFYIIAKQFVGISDKDLMKLLNTLDNLKVNHMYISHKNIPNKFVKQIYNFVDKITELNTHSIEINNGFINCFSEKNKSVRNNLKCLSYIEPKHIKYLEKKQFIEWSDIYLFT